MTSVLLLTTVCAMSLLVPGQTMEPRLSHYRSITLGDSVQKVADQLKVERSAIRVVHERPALVQQITWRPSRYVSGSTLEPDPLAEMVLTFHVDRLARIAVAYDRERTEGLTNEDLLEVFQGVYGPPMLQSITSLTSASSTAPQIIGSWRDAESLVLLWRERYPSRVGLTITAMASDLAMQEAIANGERLDATEAPARDLARRAAEATALQTRDDKVRRDNKAAFKP
jgi:hypothetical protein